MSDTLFAFFDIGLVFVLALGLAIWQLVVLKRGLRRDRAAAATQSDRPGTGSGLVEDASPAERSTKTL